MKFALAFLLLFEAIQLSESSKLKAENWKLKYQLIKLQCDSSYASLNKEQKALEEEFRKELNAQPTDTFDWASLTFKSKTK